MKTTGWGLTVYYVCTEIHHFRPSTASDFKAIAFSMGFGCDIHIFAMWSRLSSLLAAFSDEGEIPLALFNKARCSIKLLLDIVQ